MYAHWHLMQLCYPYLKGKSSSIINFTSGMYQVGLELYASYAADKGAIRALSMVAAREWGVDGIRVNTISPVAITDTILHKLAPEYSEWVKDMMSHNSMGRVGDPASGYRTGGYFPGRPRKAAGSPGRILMWMAGNPKRFTFKKTWYALHHLPYIRNIS